LILVVSKRFGRSIVALLGVLSFIAALAASGRPTARVRLQTEDTNHDGRPDVWRQYDDRGLLTHVAIDSNFDGVPDREEDYDHGALVRRETDRNFDRRTDLVEEFDRVTSERVRTIVDVDYDGAADLLVLFQNGQPVHSEWTRSGPSGHAGPPRSEGQLAALEDPFSAVAAISGRHQPAPSPDQVVASVTVAVVSLAEDFDRPLSLERVHARLICRPSASRPHSASPRGPPAPLV
jgi:hypothetical protein